MIRRVKGAVQVKSSKLSIAIYARYFYAIPCGSQTTSFTFMRAKFFCTVNIELFCVLQSLTACAIEARLPCARVQVLILKDRNKNHETIPSHTAIFNKGKHSL